MKRTPLPKRRTPIRRSGPPKQRNAKRKASEFARCYGSKARVAFVASLYCACGCGRTPCENAHTITGGIGRKGPYQSIIPLTANCHRRQHVEGWEAIGMTRSAADLCSQYTEWCWQAHLNRGTEP